jgi:hypothetical protein
MASESDGVKSSFFGGGEWRAPRRVRLVLAQAEASPCRELAPESMAQSVRRSTRFQVECVLLLFDLPTKAAIA